LGPIFSSDGDSDLPITAQMNAEKARKAANDRAAQQLEEAQKKKAEPQLTKKAEAKLEEDAGLSLAATLARLQRLEQEHLENPKLLTPEQKAELDKHSKAVEEQRKLFEAYRIKAQAGTSSSSGINIPAKAATAILKRGNNAASTSKAVDSISGQPRPFTQCLTENKARQDDERSDSVDSDDSDTSPCNPKAPRFSTLRDDEETPVSACLFSRNPLAFNKITAGGKTQLLNCSRQATGEYDLFMHGTYWPKGAIGPPQSSIS
jgi:hypothetical protein